MSNDNDQTTIRRLNPEILEIIIISLALIFVSLSRLYSYLLFHSIAELFSIIIAGGVFLVGWNSRKYMRSSFFLVLGISSLFIAVIDLIHTLAYSGMNIFSGYNANLPTSLWIAARYLQAFSCLCASLLIKKAIKPLLLLIIYLAVMVILVFLIFANLFPICFIVDSGLTPFKIISEYIINLILLICLLLIIKNRDEFDRRVFFLIVSSIITTILAELAFTFYIGVYDFSNLVGHIMKIISFYLLYRSIIQIGIEEPFNLLFRKIKRSEFELKNIIKHTGAGITMLDEDGEYLLLNEKAASELGGTPDDFIGKTLHEVLPKRLADEYLISNRELIQKGKTRSYQRTFDLSVGKKTYWIIEQPIKDIDEKYSTLLSVATDITELKLAEEKIYNLSKFPSENPNPVLRVENEQVTYSNKIGERLFNIKEGSRVPKILDASIKQSLLHNEIQNLEVKLDNQTFTLVVTPVEKANYVNIYGMDITERKKAEERLSQLISTVSHELRTPITVLLMSIEYLNKHKNMLSKDLEESLMNGISRNIQLLNELAEDILLISRIDEKRLELHWKEYSPLKIVNEILYLMEPIGKEKKVDFKVDIDDNIHLRGDSKRIDQVFRIIIDNAIKYSKENSTVEIQAIENYRGKFNLNDNTGVLFQFKDYGRGIPKDDLPNIFERFFRSSNVDEIVGTGLGLAIAKDLIEAHKGKIFAESELEKGTTFYVFLPKIE
jgi:PAS domain S-box-containing protein